MVCAYQHRLERRQFQGMWIGGSPFVLNGGDGNDGGDLLTAALRPERGQYDVWFVVPLKCLTTSRDKAGDLDQIESGIRFASTAHCSSRYPLRYNLPCLVGWPWKRLKQFITHLPAPRY